MTSQLKEVETGPRGAGTLGGWPGAAFLLSQVLRADADGNGEGVYATRFGDTRKQEQKRGSRKAPSHHCAHTHTNGGPRARPQAPPISGTTPRMPFSPESSWPGHGVARAQAAQRSRALTQGPACPGASPWSTRMTCVALREGPHLSVPSSSRASAGSCSTHLPAGADRHSDGAPAAPGPAGAQEALLCSCAGVCLSFESEGSRKGTGPKAWGGGGPAAPQLGSTLRFSI